MFWEHAACSGVCTVRPAAAGAARRPLQWPDEHGSRWYPDCGRMTLQFPEDCAGTVLPLSSVPHAPAIGGFPYSLGLVSLCQML